CDAAMTTSVASSLIFLRIFERPAVKSDAEYEPAGRLAWRSRSVSSSLSSVRRGTPPKHERAPVWQAGPLGMTLTTSASLSQSSAMLTTRWVLPEVAPLCHSSFRERDQSHVWPVSRVRRSDSSFM